MKPRDPAWKPVDYSEAVVLAFKSLATGTANDIQQKLALDWLITTAAGTYELSFRSDSDGGERDGIRRGSALRRTSGRQDGQPAAATGG